MDRVVVRSPFVSVLDADRELPGTYPPPRASRGGAMPSPEFSNSSDGAAVQFGAASSPQWPALLVINGVLIRRVSVASRTACAIFDTGDVLRPLGRRTPTATSHCEARPRERAAFTEPQADKRCQLLQRAPSPPHGWRERVSGQADVKPAVVFGGHHDCHPHDGWVLRARDG